MRNLKGNRDYVGVLSSIFAVVIGLLVGFVILLVSNPAEAADGFAMILTGAFTHGQKGVGQVFYYATPIILTGLSVGFAFKTGLFNIGTPGQFIVGALAAVAVGIRLASLGSIHWAAALLAGTAAGALWGLLPGLLKAYFNVNEVIAGIMLNYIGMYFVNFMVKSSKSIFDPLKNQSLSVAKSAQIPKMGLDLLFPGSSVNGGIFIAAAVVLLLSVILSRTAFGYELRAVGFNRDAGRYAGINEKRSIIVSMVIAGALAGMAGSLLYLAGSGKHIEVVDVLASEGFTGISVALLGLSNPVGILFAGLFIAYLTAGGFYLQLFKFSKEIIDIIVAVIIYFSAFALIIRSMLAKGKKKRNNKERGKKS